MIVSLLKAVSDEAYHLAPLRTVSYSDAWVCSDCAMVLAKGADGWGLDDDGRELGEVHAAAMRAWDPSDDDMVLSGCDPDDDCAHTDSCRYALDFSSTRCDGCGSTLAGAREPATYFVTGVAPSDRWTYRLTGGNWAWLYSPTGNLGEGFAYPTLEATTARAVALCREYTRQYRATDVPSGQWR